MELPVALSSKQDKVVVVYREQHLDMAATARYPPQPVYSASFYSMGRVYMMLCI